MFNRKVIMKKAHVNLSIGGPVVVLYTGELCSGDGVINPASMKQNLIASASRYQVLWGPPPTTPTPLTWATIPGITVTHSLHTFGPGLGGCLSRLRSRVRTENFKE